MNFVIKTYVRTMVVGTKLKHVQPYVLLDIDTLRTHIVVVHNVHACVCANVQILYEQYVRT